MHFLHHHRHPLLFSLLVCAPSPLSVIGGKFWIWIEAFVPDRSYSCPICSQINLPQLSSFRLATTSTPHPSAVLSRLGPPLSRSSRIHPSAAPHWAASSPDSAGRRPAPPAPIRTAANHPHWPRPFWPAPTPIHGRSILNRPCAYLVGPEPDLVS
jgi:hypothetical protein